MNTAKIGETLADIMRKKVLEQIVAELAFLSIPGLGPLLNPVTRYLVKWAVDWAFEKTAVRLAVLWVMVNVDFEVSNVESATKALKDMLDNPEKYSLEQQAEIEKEFDEDAVKLIRLNISPAS